MSGNRHLRLVTEPVTANLARPTGLQVAQADAAALLERWRLPFPPDELDVLYDLFERVLARDRAAVRRQLRRVK